ncbi:MAG TPA: SusD/RagB family nutrient-binding outer membrane lipoprotein [Gemmatimonadaceae bacterium]
MRRKALLTSLVLFLGTAACNDFLNSTKAVNDPNQPTTASRNTLLPGVAANIMDEQEGGVAMAVCEWMQQCAGTAGRFVEEYNKYNITGSSFNLTFNEIYTGGGLIAIRQIEDEATADNDLVYRGVAEVLEAVNMMWAADIWGSVPYSDFAVGKTDSKFDDQMAIYASLQTLLDKAITDLAGAGLGPSRFDIFYGGDKSKWTKLAHSLKARLYLRTIEKLGNAPYAQALAQANLGINAADGSDDFHGVHTTNTSERNLWFQFQLSSFGNDLVAGARLADLMIADNDPRLPDYFGKNANGGYGGQDPKSLNDPKVVSPIANSGRTTDPTFPQPFLNWEENQLIKAEANFQLGNVPAAQTLLDAVRAKYGKASKPATLQSIMEEKYINLFQNVETWNDFKRTCYPRLVPTADAFTAVPGRFFYGTTEKQTNPNVPAEAALLTARNANDPAACPTS